MTETEFNLSDCIDLVESNKTDFHSIRTIYVKEFIRLLKENLHESFDFVCECSECKNNIDEIIDKLAGEKLI